MNIENSISKSLHKNAISFLNEPNDEDFLWRYMDINKLLSFLIENKLHISRFDQLDDVHEGAPVEHLMKKMVLHKAEQQTEQKIEHLLFKIGVHLSDGIFKWSREAETKLYQQLYYTNCWLIGKRESMAMWSSYSNTDSVAIKIKYKYLKDVFINNRFNIKELEGFHELKLGKIQYIDLINLDEDIAEVYDKIQIGFTKDVSYQHENEFRICLIKSNPEKIWKKYQDKSKWLVKDEKELLANKGLSVILNDFSKLPFEIVFHPKTESFSKDNIKNLLTKLELPFKIIDSQIALR